jgi:tRNA A-37 threonylcarbamoyl transferase component Bud32
MMAKLARTEAIGMFEELHAELELVRAAANHIGTTFVQSRGRIQAVVDRGSLLVNDLPMDVNFAAMWRCADQGTLPADGGAPIHSFYRRLFHYIDAARRIMDILRDDVLWTLHGAGDANRLARTEERTPPAALHFVVGERLGAGVYGEVWRAIDTELGRSVTVKFIRTTGATRTNVLEHARALARVSHPNIVAVYEVTGIADPANGAVTDAVVMELVEGQTLVERLGRQISRDDALAICNGLLAAMEAYHQQGLAHLDLHEGNVVVGTGGVKVLDPLYFDTAALSSTATREAQQRRDARALQDILVQVLTAAGVPLPVVDRFGRDSARANPREVSALVREALIDDVLVGTALERDPHGVLTRAAVPMEHAEETSPVGVVGESRAATDVFEPVTLQIESTQSSTAGLPVVPFVWLIRAVPAVRVSWTKADLNREIQAATLVTDGGTGRTTRWPAVLRNAAATEARVRTGAQVWREAGRQGVANVWHEEVLGAQTDGTIWHQRAFFWDTESPYLDMGSVGFDVLVFLRMIAAVGQALGVVEYNVSLALQLPRANVAVVIQSHGLTAKQAGRTARADSQLEHVSQANLVPATSGSDDVLAQLGRRLIDGIANEFSFPPAARGMPAGSSFLEVDEVAVLHVVRSLEPS